MPNIPGIINAEPGAYTVVRTRQGTVSLPGGPTIVALMGKGQREEILVERAVGNCLDGESAQFDPRLDTDGRHFLLINTITGICPGSLNLFLNPRGDGTDLPLVQFTLGDSFSATDGAAWIAQFGFRPEDANSCVTLGTADDGYGTDSIGQIDEADFGLDGYRGFSTGTGFFDAAAGRRFNRSSLYPAGTREPQHYLIDESTGQLILDHPLEIGDRLVATYVPVADLNDFELFFDPEDLYRKHGFPTATNTLSLAASMAFQNGAPLLGAIQAGIEVDELTGNCVTDPDFSAGFATLEKEEDIDVVVPIQSRDINEEIVIARLDLTNATVVTETAGGTVFVEGGVSGTATGDAFGLNIWPLETNDAGTPELLEVFVNGVLQRRGVDYTVVDAAGPDPVRLVFTSALPDGSRLTANYRPLTNIVALVQAGARNHVELMSSILNRRERIAFLGSYQGFDFNAAIDSVTGIDANFGTSFRTSFFIPSTDGLARKIVNGETTTIDGQFIAAAGAGFLAGLEYLPEPLTKKTLIGFTVDRSKKFTREQIRILLAEGALVVKPLVAGGEVVQALTTVNSGNAVEEEISVVRIRDFTAQVSREILENRFVGGVIDARTIPNVITATDGILRALQGQAIITDFANVTARQDTVEPRQVDVSFDIQPVFPLNWIRIDFSIGLL